MNQVKTGTVIIALRTIEGHVILASDTALTIGESARVSGIKITNKKGILIGSAGVGYLSQLFEDEIEENAEEIINQQTINEMKFKIWECFIRVKTRAIGLLGAEMEEVPKDEKIFLNSILVLKHNNEIKILEMDSNGCLVEFPDFIAIGSTDKVLPLAKILFKKPLKLENALKAVYLIINSVSKTDPYVDGMDIWLYTKDGEIKHFSRREIRKIAREASRLEKEIWKLVYAEREMKTEKEKFEIREKVYEEKFKPIPNRVIGS
jgi:20S proteasome alpha/beta subunit